MAFHLEMDLGDERAGRIEDFEPASRRLVAHGLGDAVGAEDHDLPVGHFIELVDEHHTLVAQPVHHELVEHHFVPHVHRSAEQHVRALDDVDGAIDAGAKTAGIGELDLHDCVTRHRATHCTGFGAALTRLDPEGMKVVRPSRLALLVTAHRVHDHYDGPYRYGRIGDIEGRPVTAQAAG